MVRQPERITGNSHTITSDIWSFGMTLLECACGRYPFTREGGGSLTFFELLEWIQNCEPPKLPPSYSAEFQSLIDLWYAAVWARGSVRLVRWNVAHMARNADRVRYSLIKDPNQRPSAAVLKNHPFIKYSSVHDSRWVRELQRKREPLVATPQPIAIPTGPPQTTTSTLTMSVASSATTTATTSSTRSSTSSSSRSTPAAAVAAAPPSSKGTATRSASSSASSSANTSSAIATTSSSSLLYSALPVAPRALPPSSSSSSSPSKPKPPPPSDSRR